MDPDKKDAYGKAIRDRESEINRKRESAGGYFNWNTLEFDGYEEEYDESVDREEQLEDILLRLDDLMEPLEEAAAEKERDFVIQPVGYRKKELEEIPVCILPGIKQQSMINGDSWLHHPNTRVGVSVGVQTAKMTNQFMGGAAEVLAVGWNNICAYILVQITSSFQSKTIYY